MSSCSTPVITTVAGDGQYGFDGGAARQAELDQPVAVAVDGAGTLYIADSLNSRVHEVYAGSKVIAGNGTQGYSGVQSRATSMEIGDITGVTLDHAGNLYITGPDTNRIWELHAGSRILSTVAGNGAQSDGGDGGPASVAVDAADHLFIADPDNTRVRVVRLAPNAR